METTAATSNKTNAQKFLDQVEKPPSVADNSRNNMFEQIATQKTEDNDPIKKVTTQCKTFINKVKNNRMLMIGMIVVVVAITLAIVNPPIVHKKDGDKEKQRCPKKILYWSLAAAAAAVIVPMLLKKKASGASDQ